MEILLKPEQWVLDLYKCNNKDKLKLSNFIIQAEYDNEILLLHTITWSIYALTRDEFANILDNDILKENNVVISEDYDEYEIANEVYKVRMTKPSMPTYDLINSFVVLTTTSCNARCGYCYEKDIEVKETMTLDMAENIIKFIEEKRYKNNKPIKIQWFGGEPLLNKKVIEYITERLYELNIPFENTMISNGFLLDEDIVKKLDYWKIKNIQITLDGMNEVYNTAKNYIYSDIDAYMTVISNMHNLLNNSKTSITVRFNASNDNIFKLYDEILLLKDEFKDHYDKKISFYVAPLFQLNENHSECVDGYWEELDRIGEIIKVAKLDKCDDELLEETFKRHKFYQLCMAYNATSIAIMPNGKFTPCEHIKEEDIFGDVINGITNKSVIEKWQTFDTEHINFCKKTKCPLHPMCPKFYLCDSTVLCSDDYRKDKRIKMAIKKLIRTRIFYNNELNKLKQ